MHLSGLGLAYDLLHSSNSYLPDQPMTISNALRYLSLTLLVCFSGVPTFAQDKWMDWSKQSFQVDGRQAFVIVPQTPAEGKPWIWRTEFFGHEPQADIALLKHGFHVAYVDVQNLYGAPKALDAMDRMYDHVTSELGLSKKVTLEGFSRGGLFSLNWAARHRIVWLASTTMHRFAISKAGLVVAVKAKVHRAIGTLLKGLWPQ